MRYRVARTAAPEQDDFARRRRSRIRSNSADQPARPVLSGWSPNSTGAYLHRKARADQHQVFLTLQRAAGNAAVQRLIKSDAAVLQRDDDEEDEPVPESVIEGQEGSSSFEEFVEEGQSDGGTSAVEEEESGGVSTAEGEGTSESAEEAPEEPQSVAETEQSGSLEPIEGEPVEHSHHCDMPDSASTVPTLPLVGFGKPMPIKASLNFTSDVQQRPLPQGIAKPDSISSTLDMKSSVTQGGITVSADAFGSELVAFKVDNMKYTTAGGVVTLSATVNVDCNWDVTPRGRKDVSGPNDANVTKEKYPKIVSDLTPAADGRATREKYWAKDITEKHEQFHATDDIQRARLYLPTATAFLDGKTVTAGGTLEAQLRALISTVRDNIQADSSTYYTSVGIGGEGRAYADGKASYQQRVDDVNARAVTEKW